MSARSYRDRILRFWWLLLVCAIAGGIGGWVGGEALYTVYSSTATIQADMRAAPANSAADVLIDRVTHTGVQLALNDGVLSPIAANEHMSLATLHGEVTAVVTPNTELFTITVRDRDQHRSARLVNAIAAAVVVAANEGMAAENTESQQSYIAQLKTLSDTITSLQGQLAQVGRTPADTARAAQLKAQLTDAQWQFAATQATLNQIQMVEATQSPMVRFVSPAPPQGVLVTSHIVSAALAGAALGLALAVALVFASGWLSSSVRSPEAVESSFGWRRLGYSRELKGKKQSAAPADVSSHLTRDLRFLDIDKPVRALALISANPSPATSEVAARLANTIAREGRNTLLVDARLDAGSQHEVFGVACEPGMSDLIADAAHGGVTSDSAMRLVRSPARNADAHMRILPAGTQPPNPGRALRSAASAKAIEAIVNIPADIIVIETTPSLFAGESESLTKTLDGVIILVDSASARNQALAALNATLSASGVPLLGFVFLQGGASAREPVAETAAGSVNGAPSAQPAQPAQPARN